MPNSVRDFVRKKPKPTVEEALDFARSVMSNKGVGEDWSPYKFVDGMSLEKAKAAFEEHAFDMSEIMALEMADYALEA